MPPKITEKMNISEILRIYPGAEIIMYEHGLHCIHCQAASFEQMGEGAKTHGIKDAEIKQIIKQINTKYQQYANGIKNKHFWVTTTAQTEIKKIINEENRQKQFLKITIIKNEFAPSYSIDFDKKINPQDKLIEFNDSIVFAIPPQDYEQIKGIELDFIQTPFAKGFKITHPKLIK